MPDRTHRLAWAKLNAYGILLSLLCLLSMADLFHPGGADLARLVGEVPPGQHFWVTGFVVAGAALMYGFVRADRLAETIGLAVLLVSVIAQTVVAFWLLGWSEYAGIRLILIGIVGGCAAARVSALWARAGLVVTIPPRDKR